MKSICIQLICLLCVISKLYSTDLIYGATAPELAQVLKRAKSGDQITVGFLGGSITQGANAQPIGQSYRQQVSKWLTEHYPQAIWTFKNASVGGTGSDLGVFRLERELLQDTPPDILFVEFAVNDQGRDDPWRIGGAMEGIVRKSKQANPDIAIIFLYSFSKFILEKREEGLQDPAYRLHRQVADYYELAEVDFHAYFWQKSQDEGFDWETYWTDPAHPNNLGHTEYAQLIEQLLLHADNSNAKSSTTSLPKPLFTDDFVEADIFLPIPSEGWSETKMRTPYREHLADHLLVGDASSTPLTFTMNGTALGFAYCLIPEGLTLEVSIEGQPTKRINTKFERERPRMRAAYDILYNELPSGPKKVTVRILDTQNQPEGKAIIAGILCNNSTAK